MPCGLHLGVADAWVVSRRAGDVHEALTQSQLPIDIQELPGGMPRWILGETLQLWEPHGR